MQRTLANGLILRSLAEGVESDRANLPDFYALVNGEGDPPNVQEGLRQWTRDLIERHVTTTLDDILVVVDPAHNDRIASATLLIPQVWQYEGIPLAVGRPELVGTLPEYRRRGLVRELMGEVHRRSEALGHLLYAITGIPHYYRQFGYTMALELEQPLFLPLTNLPELAEGATPAFRLRPATEADLPLLKRWYDRQCGQYGVSDAFSDAMWHYQIFGCSQTSLRRLQVLVIEETAGAAEGAAVGFVDLYGMPYRKGIIELGSWVMGDESSYVASFNDVVRGIRDWAAGAWPEPPVMLQFVQGTPPPVQRMVARTIGGSVRPTSYTWYLRVPDPVAFLRHIGPALERRLEGSGAHRYSGALKVGFYDLTGVAIEFAQGKISDVRPLEGKDGYDISFPWHMFWNVVFGQHTWEELRTVLPEVYCDGRTAVLIDALFPKRPSWVRGLG
ncbi:MAG: GNAT family N-acetyltransferase [Caldilineaceae bacterium]